MVKHYPRNITSRPSTVDPDYQVVTFDCGCGMTGDQTVAKPGEASRAAAKRITDSHRLTVQARVSRVLGR